MEGLFCGKRLDNGAWVYGCYVRQYGGHMIYLAGADDDGFEYYHVDPMTVRPFTGLFDCTKWEELTIEEQALFLYTIDGVQRTREDWKGRPIFQGDIVKHYNKIDVGEPDAFDIGEIYWQEDTCEFIRTSARYKRDFRIGSDCIYKIIGNIYDNKVEDFCK